MIIEDKYEILMADCIPTMMTQIKESSIDCTITSVPFPSVYSYTELPEDIGNSEDLAGEMKIHFSYFFRSLLRVTKPGRVAAIHCQQIARLSRRKDMFDFRGFLIRVAKRAGWLYDNDWLIWKNAQSEAIRTHAHGLLFVTLERDRAKTRAAMGDYIIKLVKPGENAVPIDSPGITREDWIDWASPCWHKIRQSLTLNTKEAKGKNDSRHVCPLQLDTINRLIRLYSNPDELVLDPFSGIGSTAYECVKLDRRFIGCEIKQEYYDTSIKNINRAIQKAQEAGSSLFDLIEEKEEQESCNVENFLDRDVEHDPFRDDHDLDSDSISESYSEEAIDV